MSKSPKVERKLAAIMFTDIAGFTALASTNEQSALDLLQKQRDIVFPIIKSHNGILHKELGDGLLISFNLTSESVKCAINIQKSIKNVEGLDLRIGIHEGEIAIRGDDVLGDDVNVAARIEPFSAVGGISISGKVQQNISSIPDLKTDLIAKPNLKGVNQEISVYAVISDDMPFPDKSLINAKLEKDKNYSKEILISSAFGIIMFITVFFFFSSPSEANKAGFVNSNVKESFFTEEQNKLIDQVDSLLLINNLTSVELAFDIASEIIFMDTLSNDFRLIQAKTIFKLGILSDQNVGLLKRAYNTVIEIKDLEFKDYRNKAYSYYIQSNIEYIEGNKDLAEKLIKKSFYISKANKDIKMFWKKINREQLSKWKES